jgi:hypothetical protein
MNANIEKLKERLAAGEISMDEFVQMRALITEKNYDNQSNAKPTLGRLSDFVKSKIDRGGSSNNPTLEIDNKEYGKIILSGDTIVIGGEKRKTDTIKSIGYGEDSFSINFVPITKGTIVNIVFTDGKSFHISEDRVYTSFGAHGKLNKLYSQLSHASFKTRLNLLANKLRKVGELNLDHGVTLMRDGTLTNGSISVNLKKAGAHGDIAIGYEWQSLGLSSASNPNLISVSENKIKTKITLLGNSGKAQAGVIEFTVTLEDRDVSHSLLRWLSKEGNKL